VHSAPPAQGPGAVRPALVPAPLLRRALSLVYEALILAALLWCAALLYGVIESRLAATHLRALFQAYLALVAGIYFVWQWTHGGQTLPMKTWRMRLVTRSGEPVSPRQGSARYLVAMAGLLVLGLGFFWALIDRERQFLHDRVVGTRIVRWPQDLSP
jgi:uncharacterized RDD family membrane protein YckC